MLTIYIERKQKGEKKISIAIFFIMKLGRFMDFIDHTECGSYYI